MPEPRPVETLIDRCAEAALRPRAPRARRMAAILSLHPTLWRSFRGVKVAGTNGKGSVVALLGAALGAAGMKVGSFTSPHLHRVEERFRVDGAEISPALLDTCAAAVHADLDQILKQGAPEDHPSFFEALLLLAAHAFHAQGVDVVIWEAGIGGASDATSFLEAPVSAVATVGWDHTDTLGQSLAAIATDKAGIALPGTRLVLGPAVQGEARAAAAAVAAARGLRLSQASRPGWRVRSCGIHGFEVQIPVPGAPDVLHLPLAGEHQLDNLATVVALLEALAAEGWIRDLGCLAGVAAARWPARLELLRAGDQEWILDVAHNPEGLDALAVALQGLVPREQRLLVYGAATGKDLDACVARLPALAAQVVLVSGFYRARALDELCQALPPELTLLGEAGHPAEAVATVRALAAAHGLRPLVAGSVFLAGAMRAALSEGDSFAV